jgi:hypothetical protein
VARPTSGTLHVVNNSSEPMISIILDNQEYASCTNFIPPHSSYDFLFTGSGTLPYMLKVGSCSGSTPVPWFELPGSTTMSPGAYRTVTFDNPTIGQLLSNFGTQNVFEGTFWDNSIQSWGARYVFQTNGAWIYYESTGPCQPVLKNCSWSQKSSGTATLISWPDWSAVVTFRLCTGCPDLQIFYPFGMFYARVSNGFLVDFTRQ